MPRGDKSSYTDKQKREAEHIEEGYIKRGASTKKAKRIAWATVNKQSGGGKKKGSGRKKTKAKNTKKIKVEKKPKGKSKTTAKKAKKRRRRSSK